MTNEVAALSAARQLLPESEPVGIARALPLLRCPVSLHQAAGEGGRLSRELESLPNDEEFEERCAAGLGLTSPERAVLLAYSKISLNEALVESDA